MPDGGEENVFFIDRGKVTSKGLVGAVHGKKGEKRGKSIEEGLVQWRK